VIKLHKAPEGLPMYMHPMEIAQVFAIFEAVGPRRVLEWGSGGSTATLLAEFDCIQRYVSVEHHADWYEHVRSAVTDPRLELRLIPPDKPLPPGKHSDKVLRAWERQAEQDRSIFAQYIGFPRSLGLEFDLVLVDGRARTFCLAEGHAMLRPGGVLLIHDAQRAEYHAALTALGPHRFLQPWKQGQVCLLRKP
jgi:predicted O-methyltransferase YrrM